MMNLPMTKDLTNKQTIKLGAVIPAAFFLILFTALMAPLGTYPEDTPPRPLTQHARRRSTYHTTSSDEFPLHKGNLQEPTTGPSNAPVDDQTPERPTTAKEYGRDLWTRFRSPTPPPAYAPPAIPGRVQRPTAPHGKVVVVRELRNLAPYPSENSDSSSSELDVFARDEQPDWLRVIDWDLFNAMSPDRLWPHLSPADQGLLGPIRIKAWTLRREDIDV
ncbi:hypothetical protein IW261DRAFT_1425581 [Armillaria novae-zelandiae]|uniref:Uncharacterized protein n=1 Tax=Armillaria novae-zelandiae TaxID=153914 RepID=A0AA39NSX8_9AGAR|nr:hypothetical protein IW261DRAFT_1425581 [Armillaria novae-zelandiae]